MNIKYVAVLLALCLALAAVVYWQRKTSDGGPAGESEPKTAGAGAEDASSQSPAAGGSAMATEDLEERRAAARIEAIQAMENSKDPKTLTALGNALADPNPEVKEAALEALSERKGANVTEIIRRGLNDADPDFRIEVLEALAERGDLESLRLAKSDPDEDVRERAADLLENAGK
jgi:HEAT repeat protein